MIIITGRLSTVERSGSECEEHERTYTITLAGYGADLNVKDNDGISPLFVALSRNNQNSFIALIECGAAWKEESKSGGLPLLEAAARGFTKGVKAICERCGTHINVQNVTGNKNPYTLISSSVAF
ncbi:hypothetical protein HMI54_012767 [Coelomomyces lativittatus]|nr:hypothetical protein HMI54_012767 [Coelomomyces lativittatus]